MSAESKAKGEPPLYTLLMDLTGWTLDRTADIPKNARFTLKRKMGAQIAVH
jgi:hypothetical protein